MSGDVLDVLLRIHDGDDRCGCLREVIREITAGDRQAATEILENCLQYHPAGSIYRFNDR